MRSVGAKPLFKSCGKDSIRLPEYLDLVLQFLGNPNIITDIPFGVPTIFILLVAISSISCLKRRSSHMKYENSPTKRYLLILLRTARSKMLKYLLVDWETN